MLTVTLVPRGPRMWRTAFSVVQPFVWGTSISDPTNLTAAELASVQAFTDALRGFVTGLAKIKAPADLADTHAKYLDVLTRLSASFDKFYTAVKAKDNAAILTAAAEMATIIQNEDTAMTDAEAALEKALGFSLGGNTSTTSTTEAGLGGDALTYTDSTAGYTFKYPATWKVDPGTTAGASAGASATSSMGVYDPSGASTTSGYIDLMLVSTYKLKVTVTDTVLAGLEGEIQTVVDSLTGQLADSQTVAPLAQTEAAGMKGYALTFTATKDGAPITSTLYFLFKGDVEYQLTIQASTADWDKYQATFAAMVASFTAP